jgi:hypothetical protein
MKTIALQSIAADEKFAADSSHSYAVSKWRQCEPERELLAAVLEDAVLSYKKRFVYGDARFKEAQSWIFKRDTNRLFVFDRALFKPILAAENARSSRRMLWAFKPRRAQTGVT